MKGLLLILVHPNAIDVPPFELAEGKTCLFIVPEGYDPPLFD